MQQTRLFLMVHTSNLSRPLKNLSRYLKNDGHALCVLRYITPTTLHSVNVCNPTVPITVRLPGPSSLVAARLTAGPLPELLEIADGRCRLNHARILTSVLRRDIKGAPPRSLMLVSVFPSRREFCEPKAIVAEHRPRLQAQENAPSVSAPVLSSRLPLNTAKVYAQVVPELASLLDHMERKSPVLVISTTDAGMETFLPFQLPSEYGCVVLGFFDVQGVEVGGAFPYTPQVIPRFSNPLLTSVRVRIPFLPQAFNLGNFHGEYDYVIHLHQMRRIRMGI